MRRTRSIARSACVVSSIALLAGLAGCGSSSFADESAADIVTAAKTDTTGASSVHLNGSVDQKGQEITLDLQVDDKGDCKGSIKLDGGTAEILGVDGKYWFKPDDAFWKAEAGAKAPQIIAAVGDKYVASDEFGDTCDLDQLFKSDKTDKADEKAGTSTIDGQEVVQIDSTDDQGNPSHAYILTSSPHYVVKLVGDGDSSGNDKGTFTLSDFGDELDAQAPAADDVADLGTTGG